MAASGVSDLADCPGAGVEFHPFPFLSQTPGDYTVEYGPNMGYPLVGTNGLMMNVHYLNTSGSPVTPEVKIGRSGRPFAAAHVANPPDADKGGNEHHLDLQVLLLSDRSSRTPPTHGRALRSKSAAVARSATCARPERVVLCPGRCPNRGPLP